MISGKNDADNKLIIFFMSILIINSNKIIVLSLAWELRFI